MVNSCSEWSYIHCYCSAATCCYEGIPAQTTQRASLTLDFAVALIVTSPSFAGPTSAKQSQHKHLELAQNLIPEEVEIKSLLGELPKSAERVKSLPECNVFWNRKNEEYFSRKRIKIHQLLL